jgi:hypothetical protein
MKWLFHPEKKKEKSISAVAVAAYEKFTISLFFARSSICRASLCTSYGMA